MEKRRERRDPRETSFDVQWKDPIIVISVRQIQSEGEHVERERAMISDDGKVEQGISLTRKVSAVNLIRTWTKSLKICKQTYRGKNKNRKQ